MSMHYRNNITAEHVRSVLHYDPETGVFRWLPNPTRPKAWNTRFANKPTGSLDVSGCLSIRITEFGLFLAHRLAWLYTSGAWPTETIDHINGDRSDNRIANLREATQAENMRNRAKQSNNRSGFLGISYSRDHKKWRAAINLNKKTVWRAYAETAQEAAALRRAALPLYHGEFIRPV